MKDFFQLREKSVSQAQQKMMGMALAYKRGEMDDASPEVKKMADSMSMKDLEDFAKTKHKGLPVKKESVELEEKSTVNVIGGTSAKGGELFMGTKGIDKMIELSKKNPKIQYTVKSDNYGNFKPLWLRNGKFAKKTVANIEFDMDKNAVRGKPKGKDVNDTIFSLSYVMKESVDLDEAAKMSAKSQEWYDKGYAMGKNPSTYKNPPYGIGGAAMDAFRKGRKAGEADVKKEEVEEAANPYQRYTSSEVKKRQAEREKRNAGTTPAQRMRQKMYGNMMGGLKKEEIEIDEAAPKPPKLKGNDGPYTRQQIEKAAKEAKVDMGAKARMMMALRKM